MGWLEHSHRACGAGCPRAGSLRSGMLCGVPRMAGLLRTSPRTPAHPADPANPTRRSILHWLVTNIPASSGDISEGTVVRPACQPGQPAPAAAGLPAEGAAHVRCPCNFDLTVPYVLAPANEPPRPGPTPTRRSASGAAPTRPAAPTATSSCCTSSPPRSSCRWGAGPGGRPRGGGQGTGFARLVLAQPCWHAACLLHSAVQSCTLALQLCSTPCPRPAVPSRCLPPRALPTSRPATSPPSTSWASPSQSPTSPRPSSVSGRARCLGLGPRLTGCLSNQPVPALGRCPALAPAAALLTFTPSLPSSSACSHLQHRDCGSERA